MLSFILVFSMLICSFLEGLDLMSGNMETVLPPGSKRKDQGTPSSSSCSQFHRFSFTYLYPLMGISLDNFPHPLCFISCRSFQWEREQLSLHFHPGFFVFVPRPFLSRFSIYRECECRSGSLLFRIFCLCDGDF